MIKYKEKYHIFMITRLQSTMQQDAATARTLCEVDHSSLWDFAIIKPI